MPAPGLSPADIARILAVHAETGSIAETARRTKSNRGTVSKYVRRAAPAAPVRHPSVTRPSPTRHPPLPPPAPEAGGPVLPDPVAEEFAEVHIDTPGPWGVLSDPHLPYHDVRTINLFMAECQRRAVAGVLLNGDVLDFYGLSVHYQEPNKPRMRQEIECGRAFFAWLRAGLPRARLVYRLGNHDERLRRYLARKAPEIFDLDELHLSNLLGLSGLGVELVENQSTVYLGKLATVHGHEFRGQGGIMPARWLYLRTGSSALCGHFHRPSYYPFRTLEQKQLGSWSLGCACFLHPQYLRVNQWEHGFAFVDVAADGGFRVDNRIVLKDGRVV